MTRQGAAIVDNSIPENSEPVIVRIDLPRAVEVGTDPAVILLTTDSPQSINLPSTAIIRPGDTFIDVPVQPLNNDIVDAVRNLNIIADLPGYVSASVAMTITEDDIPELRAALVIPNNQIGSTANSVSEQGGRATIVLTRNTIGETTVRFNATTAAQLVLPESIVFPRGFRRLEIPITTLDNNVVDGNRTTEVTITATGHPQTSVSLNVIDNEIAGLLTLDSQGSSITAPLTINESTNTLLAGNSRNVFVRLPSAPITNVAVGVTASSQLSVSQSELTFTPLNWDQPQAVLVSAIDDQRTTGNVDARVNFRVIASRSDPAFDSVLPVVRNVTLIDNDSAAIEIVESSGTTFASEIGIVDRFQIRLSTQPTAPVTLRFDSSEIQSVNVVPNSVTFTPENWNVLQSLSVETDLDFDADGHEIGLVFVDAVSEAVGYNSSIGRRRLSVVHVDTDLSDLRVRRVNDDVVLVDEVSRLEFLRQPLFGSVFTTGSRNETLTVDAGVGLDTIRLDTSGGDDTVIVDQRSRVDINGSAGYDTLALQIEDFIYDPSLVVVPQNPTSITARNIEEINTLGNGVQTLVLNSDSVRAMTDERNDLFLRVDPEDVVTLGPEWGNPTPVLRDKIPSHVFTSGDVTLRLVAGAMWQNPVNPVDVDSSGTVSALDALLIINRLNSQGESTLPTRFEGEGVSVGELLYYDVSGDGAVTALDALQTINYLNMPDGLASANSEPLSRTPPNSAASIVVNAAPIATASSTSPDPLPQYDESLIETLDENRNENLPGGLDWGETRGEKLNAMNAADVDPVFSVNQSGLDTDDDDSVTFLVDVFHPIE